MADTKRAIVRIAFNNRRPPTLDEVREAIEKTLGPSRCAFCGFDGIDVLLQLEEIVNPAAQPWVSTKVGGEVFGG
jgi:hypothetical protein